MSALNRNLTTGFEKTARAARIEKSIYYFNLKTLQSRCCAVIQKDLSLEVKLYKSYPRNLDYKYKFEEYLEDMLEIVRGRHIRDAQSFERWFRKFTTEKVNLMLENKENLKDMMLIADCFEKKMLKFKKLFGMSLEVFRKNASLSYRLRAMQMRINSLNL